MRTPIVLLAILFTMSSTAQEKPTLYLIGDSTMSDKKDPEKNPEHGWGQMLPELLTSEINIENHAVNGRSTRSFIAEGKWNAVKNKLKSGDYVFIQFGHNDQKVQDSSRYTNPFTQYRANLERFVNEAREKGAFPILFSSIVRRNFNEDGVFVDTHGEYPLVVRMLAKDLDVPFIDLQLLSEQLEISYGPEKSKKLHLHLEPGDDAYEPEGRHDDTHLSEMGALKIATLALKAIDKKELDFSKYILSEVLHKEPANIEKTVTWKEAMQQSDDWYAKEDAQRIANNVLLYQHNNGGWLKNIDMAGQLSRDEVLQLKKEQSNELGTTIDNGATHTQLRYLAKVYRATGNEDYKEAFLRGIDYLFEAQYENGGWPQFYPIKKGYYEHITYNDGAMIGVMELLRNITLNKKTYDFVDKLRKKKAQNAIDKGLEIILASQVKVNGKLTIWCAQHDKDDLSPAKARAYELPSLSGKESTEIVEYLIKLKDPSLEVKTAIRSAVQWFKEHQVTGKKVVWANDSTGLRDRKLIVDKDGKPLWGRFNDIETGVPFFVGRDGKKMDHLEDIEIERRTGYNYIDSYAYDLLTKKYPKWEKKQ